MPTKVKEIQQYHYIVDQSYRGETINSETVIAGVVASSTGPCEEMVIDSVAELCDLYLNSDSITSDSDTTLQHAAKILQFSPIHIVRAANDKIKAGVTNLGDVIYTDENYTPFKYSKKYTIENPVADNIGFIGFERDGQVFFYNFVDSDGEIQPSYLTNEIKEEWKKNEFNLSVGEEVPSGIDPIFSKINEIKLAGIPDGIGFDFTNKDNHIVYTTKDVAFNYYPGVFGVDGDTQWVNISNTDISNDVFELKVEKTDKSYINEGEAILNLNGYSFYLGVDDETKELDLPGTGIEININREEGSVVSPETFALYVFDEIVKSDKFKNPVISNVDSSISFYPSKIGKVTIVTDMNDLISIYEGEEEQEWNDKLWEKEYNDEDNLPKITIRPKASPETIFDGDKYLFINFGGTYNNQDFWTSTTKKKPGQSTETDTEGTVGEESQSTKEGSEEVVIKENTNYDCKVKVDGKTVTVYFEKTEGIINDTVEVNLAIKDSNGDPVASASTIPYYNSAFSSWSGSKSTGVSAKFVDWKEGINGEDGHYSVVINNFPGSRGIERGDYIVEISYKHIEFEPNSGDSAESKTYAMYFNQSSVRAFKNATVGVGKTTVAMAVFKMGVAMTSWKDEEKDKCKFKSSGKNEDPIEQVGDIAIYGLKSNWRTMSSSSPYFKVTNPDGFTRSLVSKDRVNFTQQKSNFVLKIGNIVFYNGPQKSYIPSSNSEDTYNLSTTPMTFEDFMAAVVEELPSFASVLPTISDGNVITLFSNSDIDTEIKFGVNGEKLEIYTGEDQKSYEYELSSRFAIISSFPSNTKLFGVKMTSRDDGTFDLSIRRKTTTSTNNVSFVPGAVNGYGNGIYFDYVNSDVIDYKVIDLDLDAKPVEIPEEITFGDEIVVPAPGLTQRKAALSKLTLDTGYYYNYITELGYTNASFDAFADSVAKQLNSQYIFTAPKDYLTVSSIKSYREATGLDSRNSSMFTPFYKDNSLGNFIVDLSPSVKVLERLLSNKALFKEFAPAYGPVNGELLISTKRSSSSGLLVDFNTREQREELLSSQVNPLRIDRGLGIVYIDDMWTTQRKDSYLSDFNNMYMTNIIQHVLDVFMKQYFAQANNDATRGNVVSILTTAFNDRLFANQSYTPYSLQVICDRTNNPDTVVNDRKLIVDVKAFYEVAIKYIETYTRVLNLSEA